VNLQELQVHLFGWPGQMTLAVASVPFIAGRASRWDWLLLATATSLIGVYITWWAEGLMYGPRYYYEALVALVLLTARGVDEGGTLLGQASQRWRAGARLVAASSGINYRPPERSGGSPPSMKARRTGGCEMFRFAQHDIVDTRQASGYLAAYFLVASLVMYNAVCYLPMQVHMHHGYNFVNGEALRAVERAGVRDALVFVRSDQWYAWWTYGSVFSANSPLLETSVVYAQDLGAECNRQLMRHFPSRTPYLLHGTKITRWEDADGSGG
jgi:hypothetical protein